MPIFGDEALEPLPWAWAVAGSVVHMPEMLIMSHATCLQSVCRCNFTTDYILRVHFAGVRIE